MFVIKNLSDHDIELDGKKLEPGKELSSEQLTDDINAAANKAEISITVVAGTESKPLGGSYGMGPPDVGQVEKTPRKEGQ